MAIMSFSNQTAKTWINRLGTLIGISGVIFVIDRLFTYHDMISFDNWSPYTYIALAVLCIFYASSNLALVFGWHYLLIYLGTKQNIFWCLKIYAVTQIAKYVPGNIFQFAGRQALGFAKGIPHVVLIKSTILELLLLTLAGTALAPIFVYKLIPNISIETALTVFAGFGIFVFILFIYLIPRSLLYAASCYAAQVITSSIIFCFVFMISGGEFLDFTSPITVIAGFSLSWLVGLLTPGAPAGIGVRESALLFLLGDMTTPSVILAAAILGRLVTVVGDLLFYSFGKLIR